MKCNTGADPGEFKGFRGTPRFASDTPLISLDKPLKMLLKFKQTKISALSHNKIL